MTAFVPTSSTIGPAIAFSSVAAGDSVTLLQPFTFFNTGGTGVSIQHANHDVFNMTTVIGGGAHGLVVNSVSDCNITNAATGTIASLDNSGGLAGVIMLGNRNVLRNQGEITSTNGTGVDFSGTGSVVDNSGTIFGGSNGIVAGSGNYSILNSGTISAGAATFSVGVYLAGSGASRTLVNAGTIQTTATDSGAAIEIVANGVTTIRNSGTILSVGGLALDASLASGSIQLTNSGTMTGTEALGLAIAGTNLSDTIINTGHINRSVSLGGGDDLFDGRGGTVGGTVLGNDGNDTYRISDTLAAIFEGAGEGTADRVESTVSFALAQGSEIEQLTLLGTAMDGTGNEYNNILTGNGMDNRLSGGAVWTPFTATQATTACAAILPTTRSTAATARTFCAAGRRRTISMAARVTTRCGAMSPPTGCSATRARMYWSAARGATRCTGARMRTRSCSAAWPTVRRDRRCATSSRGSRRGST